MIDQLERFVFTRSFGANVVAATLFWTMTLPLLRIMFVFLASTLFNKKIPAPRAYVPSRVPHPNPAGSAVPFEIPLEKASDDEIRRFMNFRGRENWTREKDGLDVVAAAAAAYKGELYEERTMRWIDDHFRRKLPNLQYPYVAAHWNGWSSFWGETAPHIRDMCIASLLLTLEHLVNGLILPALYLYTGRIIYFDLSMYGEIGYQVVSCTLITASYLLGRDVTVEQMHRAVWPLLLTHHACAIFLCTLSLKLGDSCPRDDVCYFLFALLGLTSTLHYLGVMLDFSPLSQANSPYVRMVNHIVTLASMIWFRCIYWFKIAFLAVDHAARTSGHATAVMVALVLLLFTAFNADFVKFHIKATRGCWKKIAMGAKEYV